MGQVTAHGQVEAHEGVARLQAGHDDGHVRLGAGMRLYVGILRIVDLAEAVDRQLLDLVHHLATAIVALAGVAFGVFVGTDGTHGFHDLVGHIVLGGNQFQSGRLTVPFFLDQVENLKILFHSYCFSV